MDLSPVGETLALTLHIGSAEQGSWQIRVGGARHSAYALAPATLVISLWCPIDAHVVRGTIQLVGSECRQVVFQSSDQLLELLQHWAGGGQITAPGS